MKFWIIFACVIFFPMANACPEVPKGITVKESTFKRYKVGVNCAVWLNIGKTFLDGRELDKFVPGPIKDEKGAVVGFSERSGNRFLFFSVNEKKSKDSSLPYLAVDFKNKDEATIEMIKRGKIVGRTNLESKACTRAVSFGDQGTTDVEMEGSALKSGGEGCGSSLTREPFVEKTATLPGDAFS